jgi:hypothetical protein
MMEDAGNSNMMNGGNMANPTMMSAGEHHLVNDP